MSAVKVIRYLLANNSPLNVVVPADKIMAGKLPQGIVLPAISIMHIVTTRRRQVRPTTTEFCTSRIQVTVNAPNYPDMSAVLLLIRAALPNTKGLVAGVKLDCILPDSDGPDFGEDEIGSCLRSKDYIVMFNE